KSKCGLPLWRRMASMCARDSSKRPARASWMAAARRASTFSGALSAQMRALSSAASVAPRYSEIRYARSAAPGSRVAQVLGNPIGALGHARVAGGLRVAQIVGQGDVEAPALAGQFGGEQGEQGVRGERGVLDRFLGRGVRLGGVVGGGGQCLAAQ